VDLFVRLREHFKCLLNTVPITPSETHGVQSERNKIITAEFVVAVKTVKAGKATDCDEIQIEMPEALNRVGVNLSCLCVLGGMGFWKVIKA